MLHTTKPRQRQLFYINFAWILSVRTEGWRDRKYKIIMIIMRHFKDNNMLGAALRGAVAIRRANNVEAKFAGVFSQISHLCFLPFKLKIMWLSVLRLLVVYPSICFARHDRRLRGEDLAPFLRERSCTIYKYQMKGKIAHKGKEEGDPCEREREKEREKFVNEYQACRCIARLETQTWNEAER